MTEPGKPKQTPEEEIRAYTVGQLEPRSSPIFLSEYDPSWPRSYEREAARVRGILGDRVKLIEHVGSTSVVDLPAKPTIDLVLAVADSADEATYLSDLEREQYVLRIREPHWFEHRLFKGPDTDIHLHVFSFGCAEIEQMLTFRDWLRAHQQDRALYAATKRALAKQEWKFVQHYADAKTEIVQEILSRARASSRSLLQTPPANAK